MEFLCCALNVTSFFSVSWVYYHCLQMFSLCSYNNIMYSLENVFFHVSGDVVLTHGYKYSDQPKFLWPDFLIYHYQTLFIFLKGVIFWDLFIIREGKKSDKIKDLEIKNKSAAIFNMSAAKLNMYVVKYNRWCRHHLMKHYSESHCFWNNECKLIFVL